MCIDMSIYIYIYSMYIIIVFSLCNLSRCCRARTRTRPMLQCVVMSMNRRSDARR